MTRIKRLKSLGLTFSLLVAGLIFGILPLGKLIAADPTDATLSNLAVSTGTLNPVFKSGTYTYTMVVSYGVESVKLSPTAAEEEAIITVDKTTDESLPVVVESGSATSDIPLDGGGKQTVIKVQVTSPDESKTLTYTVAITREMPELASLSGLSVKYGDVSSQTNAMTMDPAFNTDILEYEGVYSEVSSAFPATVTHVQIAPALWEGEGYSDASIAVTANGKALTLAAEQTYYLAELLPGENVFDIQVTGSDDSVRTYTLNMTRTISNDATLQDLGVYEGTSETNLVSAFEASKTTYQVTTSIMAKDDAITLEAVAAGYHSTVEVEQDGVAVEPEAAGGSTYLISPMEAGEESIITIEVTAENGAVKNYTVGVTRTANDETGLDSIWINGTYEESKADVFGEDEIGEYTLPNTLWKAGEASFGAELTDPEASYMVSLKEGETYTNLLNGALDVSEYAVAESAVLRITVTAEDGTLQNYELTVTMNAASADATLSNGTDPFTSKEVTPAATADGDDGNTYEVTVPYAVSALDFNPLITDEFASMEVIEDKAGVVGTAVLTDWSSVSLNVGLNTLVVTVLAEDGETEADYTYLITRSAASSAATFDVYGAGIKSDDDFDMAMDPSAFTENEKTGVYESSASVETDISSIYMNILYSDNATLKINGVPAILAGVGEGSSAELTSASTDSLNLSYGKNLITIEVTAEDGVTKETYTLEVTRAYPASADDATLKSIGLSAGALLPDFDSATKYYTVAAPSGAESVTVTPVTNNPDATVEIMVGETILDDGVVSLPMGETIVTIEVTSQDKSVTETYYVAFSREASADSSLSALALSQGTLDPEFDAETAAYTASVANSVSSITVTPTASDANSSITVDGETVLSGEACAAFSLEVGENTIEVVVTAEDGTTISTYTITVTREEAAPEVTDYSGTYFIKSLNSGLVMDIYGGGRTNGANIIQWAKHGGLNQQWKFTATGDGYYTITSVLNPQFSLDVFGGGSSIGQRVIQYTSLPHQINQKWKIIENDGGTITLQSQLAETNGTGYVLDVFGGGKTAGVNVIQWTNTGGDNQKWILEAVQD